MTDIDWANLHPIAHRGLHDRDRGIIENTRSAVQAAIDAGYGIEVDLQLSADSRAMVFHDAALERLTLASGNLIEYTAKELQNIDFAQTPDRIMTLEELLDLVAGNVPLFLEIKSRWGHVGALEEAVANALATYSGPAAIMSFDPESVAYFRHNAPHVTRGIVAGGFHDTNAKMRFSFLRRFSLRHLLHWTRTKPEFVAYNVKYLNYPAPRIARRLFNISLLAWTVRNEDDLNQVNLFGAIPIFEGMRP